MRIITALLLIPAIAQAAPSAEMASPGLLGSSLRLLAGLLLVVGFLLLLYALSRRGLAWLPKAKGSLIQVREMRPLGPKKSLCLVEVRGRELLLGIGADRIEMLKDLGEATRGEFEAQLQAGIRESRS
ncbi:MAG: flagellar biosynthetic protein FliO [Syntrophotaleaceae bacterium]